MNQVTKIKLKKGDVVVVRTGRDKGKTGTVTAVHPTLNTVTVEGINMQKKHVKPNKQYPQGAIIDRTIPIAVSKVGLLEPTKKKASRVKISVSSEGQKKRVFALTNKEVK